MITEIKTKTGKLKSEPQGFAEKFAVGTGCNFKGHDVLTIRSYNNDEPQCTVTLTFTPEEARRVVDFWKEHLEHLEK